MGGNRNKEIGSFLYKRLLKLLRIYKRNKLYVNAEGKGQMHSDSNAVACKHGHDVKHRLALLYVILGKGILEYGGVYVFVGKYYALSAIGSSAGIEITEGIVRASFGRKIYSLGCLGDKLTVLYYIFSLGVGRYASRKHVRYTAVHLCGTAYGIRGIDGHNGIVGNVFKRVYLKAWHDTKLGLKLFKCLHHLALL